MARKSSQAIRDMLDQQVPVAFSIPVYAVWANPSGKVPMPIPYAPKIGGHALCAAGYTLDPSAPGGGWIIAKNSWGTKRAPLSPAGPGYFYLPFGYVDQYGWETATLA
jgi:C1A family cysteine protease